MSNLDHLDSAPPIALITGANTGIGRYTAWGLVERGYRVYLACRSESKTQAVIDEILKAHPSAWVKWLPIDLANFSAIQSSANSFLLENSHLDLLINNAGVGGEKGCTVDGFEVAFGVNHMGHFLLTHLLMGALLNAKAPKVVTVASNAHRFAWGIDWLKVRQETKSILGAKDYAVSKLANILFSSQLSKHYSHKGLATYSLHPGVIRSDFWRHLPLGLMPLIKWGPLISPQQGARTSLYCALDAPHSETGFFYANSRIKKPTVYARNESLAAELWEKSADWIKQG
jgi:NAD(P)-dependent dehydrogenase (short-subunit alcohol dehydrogenase family)